LIRLSIQTRSRNSAASEQPSATIKWANSDRVEMIEGFAHGAVEVNQPWPSRVRVGNQLPQPAATTLVLPGEGEIWHDGRPFRRLILRIWPVAPIDRRSAQKIAPGWFGIAPRCTRLVRVCNGYFSAKLTGLSCRMSGADLPPLSVAHLPVREGGRCATEGRR
jgi:hypothetical protein